MSPAEEVNLPLAFMQAREIRLVPTFRFANAYHRAIGLVAAGAVRPDAIVTGHFPLEETGTALRAGRTDPGSVKAVVTPGERSR
jgi:L-iditol 2-dehydrogenase